MKITVLKEKILSAIQVAERITGKKESLPVLACLLFDVDKEMVVRATNLEAGVEVKVPGDVQEKGQIAVPAAIISQTIRAIGEEKITLQTEGINLLVESRGTRTLIKAIAHDEFPSLPKQTPSGEITIPRDELLKGFHTVSYAASPSMIRPELGSIYLSVKEGTLTCVATDSFRLAEKVLRVGKTKEEKEILIPLKHALEITHILEHGSESTVTLSADETQLFILTDGVRYLSRVVDGAFPNYKEIIPKSFATEATVLKADFADMLKKARVFAGSDQHMGFHLYPKRKIFTATAQNADVGEMSDSIDAALSGEDMDINFHIGYLADCISSLESDSLTLNFSGQGKPLVIHGVSDATFTYLVMPLNR